MSSAFERLQKLAEQKKNKEKPKLEVVPKDTQPTQPTIPNQDKIPNEHNQDNQPDIANQPNQASQPVRRKPRQPVSPEKDFTKVPNSVSRVAVPERLFRGMSKNTYDALYLKTRGAITPIRRIRATKSDLIRWTGVSDVTLDKHLKHLKSVGLVNWEFVIGSHDGNWYEVFVPEEIDPSHLTNLTNSNVDNQPNKVGGQVPNLVGGVGGGQMYDIKDFSQNSKTSFKTNTNDDESAAFSRFIGKFAGVSEKLTGKKISRREAENWEALADLLILELEVAASRAGTVSSVPAFLTEVLRRQFFAARREQKSLSTKSNSVKPDTVGKSDSETFEIKSLDEQGREAALEQLKEFADEPFLEDFKKWYTEDDWQWLKKQLEKIESIN